MMYNLEEKINTIAKRKVARILASIEENGKGEIVQRCVKGEIYQFKDDVLKCIRDEIENDGENYNR